MLKNIDPLLGGELLCVLRSMGHGDELVLADANFPSRTVGRRVVDLIGVDVIRAAETILSVFPLDSFSEAPILGMEVVGDPGRRLEIHGDFEATVSAAAGREVALALLERQAFYERARQAFAVVATGERRPYGDFIVVKGVIAEDGRVG